MQINTYRIFMRKKGDTSDCSTLVNATSESEAQRIIKSCTNVDYFIRVEKIR